MVGRVTQMMTRLASTVLHRSVSSVIILKWIYPLREYFVANETYTQMDGVLTAHVESVLVSKGRRTTRRMQEVMNVLVSRA